MPMRSHRIFDGRGNAIGIACYREPRRTCSTVGCTKPGTLLCDYPVVRRGRKTTCSRYMCTSCAKRIGPECDYCPPHAREHEKAEAAAAEQRASDEKFREIMAGFRPARESDE
jgi:hypothetical protein